MGVVVISGDGTHLFDSNDTVTITAGFTLTGSINKTDSGDGTGMTIAISAGVIVTVTSGAVTLVGGRGIGAEPDFVILDSAAADRRAGDWNYFIFNSSADTTSKWNWVMVKNCTHGLIFQGTKAPVLGDYDFLVGYNMTLGALGFSNSGTGNIVISNVAHFKSAYLHVDGGKTYTATGIFVMASSIDVVGVGFFENWKDNGTMTDLHWERSHVDHAFGISSGKTLVLTRPFIRALYKAQTNEFKPDSGGTLTMADGILMGGLIPLHLGVNAGTLNATNCDVRDGNEASQGVFESGGTLNTTSCAVTNTLKYEHGNFNVLQYNQTNGTNTTPRTSLNHDHTFSNQAVGVAATANSIRLDADTGISAKVRVRFWITGDVNYMVTEWDAPDRVLASIGEVLPSTSTDWGITAGAKFKKTGHQLTLKNLQEGKTYNYVYELIGIDGVKFSDPTVRTFTTTSSSDTTPPVFSGGVSGLAVSDAETDKDINVSCNSAVDSDSGLLGFKYYFKLGDGDPFASPDFTRILPTNEITPVRVSSSLEYSVGVRAIDNVVNETTNTDFLTVTPTGAITKHVNQIVIDFAAQAKTIEIAASSASL